MTAKCPRCGQPLPESGKQLVERMKKAHGMGAKCYAGQGGGYYIEYGGGEVSKAAIDDALAKGLIKPAWDDKPELECWRIA